MFGRSSKQLTCPACGAVIAAATYRRFPPDLVLVDPDGARLQPENAGDLERRLRAAVERAPSPAEAERARERLAFVRRNFGELVYDLHCRTGHSILRTMPQLARIVRDSAGQWVDVG